MFFSIFYLLFQYLKAPAVFLQDTRNSVHLIIPSSSQQKIFKKGRISKKEGKFLYIFQLLLILSIRIH